MYGRENYKRRKSKVRDREWHSILKAGANVLHADRKDRKVGRVPRHSEVVQ